MDNDPPDPFRSLLGGALSAGSGPLPWSISHATNPPPAPTFTPSSSSPASSSLEKIESSIQTFEKLVAQGKLTTGACVQLFGRIKALLLPFFGEKSAIIKTLVEWVKDFQKLKSPQGVIEGRLREVKHFTSILGSFSASSTLAPFSHPSLPPKTRQVFIVHGHDEMNWRRLDGLLRVELKLEPIVILARAGQSQPTIQKFENDAAKCAYAFAFFTPDDEVTAKSSGLAYAQARPNVIFETGWFVGRLGKERVALLTKEGTKLHSDFDGLNRIEFKDDVTDKFIQIKRELDAAGMT